MVHVMKLWFVILYSHPTNHV